MEIEDESEVEEVLLEEEDAIFFYIFLIGRLQEARTIFAVPPLVCLPASCFS